MFARVFTIAIALTFVLASTSLANTVSSHYQQDSVNSVIEKLARENEVRCECSWIAAPSPIEVDCASPKLDVKLKSLRNNTITVPLEIRCDNKRLKIKWYRLSCRAEKIVLITTRKIEQNELITPDSIQTKWIPIELAQNAVTKVEDALGKKIRSSISGGTILRLQMLETPRPVEKGDPILIIYRSGSLQVSSIAIAQKSGSRGNIIPVMNVESQKVFFARIISNGKAEPIIASGVNDENN